MQQISWFLNMTDAHLGGELRRRRSYAAGCKVWFPIPHFVLWHVRMRQPFRSLFPYTSCTSKYCRHRRDVEQAQSTLCSVCDLQTTETEMSPLCSVDSIVDVTFVETDVRGSTLHCWIDQYGFVLSVEICHISCTQCKNVEMWTVHLSGTPPAEVISVPRSEVCFVAVVSADVVHEFFLPGPTYH